MREGLKDDRYNLRMPPPEPLVPRDRRLGVRERMRADGRIAMPLDDGLARRARSPSSSRRASRPSRSATCTPGATPRTSGDRRGACARRCPTPMSRCPSEVLPQIKEYERVWTTVVNAYVGPALARYLTRLERGLREAGYARPGPDHAVARRGRADRRGGPARRRAPCCPGRPAASPAAATPRRLIGHDDLIPFDMGGTSTDISLIVGGEPRRSPPTGGSPATASRCPRSTSSSIGAGGGSIARVDAGGMLHVGPESAGAEPGPACYGRGGSAATVTDANLVLGLLDPGNFLGGRAPLDRAAAERARSTHRRRARDRPDRGRGRHPPRRQHSHGRGHPPGLGAARRRPARVRAARLRRRRRPARHRDRAPARARGGSSCRASPPCSRPGACSPPICATRSRAATSATPARSTAAALRALFDELEAEGRRRLAARRSPGASASSARPTCATASRSSRSPSASTTSTGDAPTCWPSSSSAFHHRHEELYTYALPDQEAVLVNARRRGDRRAARAARGAARCPTARPAAPASAARDLSRAWQEVPVFDFDALAPAQAIAGPAIVEIRHHHGAAAPRRPRPRHQPAGSTSRL